MSIKCPHCGREFPGDKLNARHLSLCNPQSRPKVPPCLCGHESTSLTQMKRHRRTCAVWKNRDVEAIRRARMEATSLKRYGVEDASQAPEVLARREATNRERYGAPNPFCREASTFNAVQAAMSREGLKGEANPFAWPEVQEKIRGHWQREYGVDGPQQVPEIRARTKTTNLGRYGGELLGSPELAAKARKTNLARYGDEYPQRTEGVLAKQQVTNRARYGVPWTAMDPKVRAKQLAAMDERYGSHFFASDEGKSIIREVMLERYGVQFPGEMEGHWKKAVAAFRKRFGVDHPLQVPEILAKARQTCIDRYGTPFPGLRNQGPNGLESAVHDLAPHLMFTGDGSFWRHLPKLGHFKNPDFILPGPDPEHPMRGVTKVVEAFGDFWHGRMKTGKANFEHEHELIQAFAEISIECLVLWESEVKSDPAEVGQRLAGFLSS